MEVTLFLNVMFFGGDVIFGDYVFWRDIIFEFYWI